MTDSVPERPSSRRAGTDHYLDHAATTPMLPQALDAWVAVARDVGNPASVHAAGQRARALVEEGRARVAASAGADPAEVVFTSGGTESVNTAIKGIHWWRDTAGDHPVIVLPEAEHRASEAAATWLAQRQGAELQRVPVDRAGRVDLDRLERILDASGDRVSLVSLLAANNEVGTIQPVRQVVRLAAAHGVPVHVDAVSAYGQIPVDLHGWGAAAVSVAAHKIGGPMGVGALLLRRDVTPVPLLHGGGQERRVRSGTLDVPGIAAFGVAAEHAETTRTDRARATAVLRDRLIAGIEREVPDAIVTGARGDERLPGNVHAVFPGCEGDSLLFLLDAAGVRASTGAACSAAIPQPSDVLRAMGFDAADARSALRFTLGERTTAADVDAVLAVLPEVVARARRAGMSARRPTRF
ncbi:cysteine desulfurase family protein [Pseudoclavibacter caeni]|jgi:cysteine desulfurase|uniref:Cysteine desulfurase n=1 Tax=Pseudoclavibacter caeni TaxID=908846 RepID=A0A7C8FXW9_9MICO|nr:cysteine desulfurase family protein [Pseudoclavibacter caeni]KAB1632297.1 cysteine desulfurase [Pseudoclavibacter caeni]NYJ97528.1 cysteine desulfurase [Pseudoclavibacter caeni]